jgi:AI-2 transport protein TqsA
MEGELKKIRTILVLMSVPVALYLLHVLQIIFIPLAFALFGALLFMPLMRWLNKRRVPNVVGIVIVLVIIVGTIKIGYEVVSLSAKELSGAGTEFYTKFDAKLDRIISPVMDAAGIFPKTGESNIEALLGSEQFSENIFGSVGSTLNFTRILVSMSLMTLFFMILLLLGSMDIQKVMELLIFKGRYASVKTFLQVEKDILKFIVVKFLLSLFTGIGFGVACYTFGVSFPFFWGLFAFLINFIQMIGSVISVAVLTAFALVEIESTGTLLFFISVLTGVQVLFGAILEPILMGRSFKINTVTVLVMLALWGFIWGIPGLILSIPLTALIKKIMEQFPGTAVYARIMS